MQARGAKMRHEPAHVRDVIVEMERARGKRHHARVDPVGDVDLVIAKQRAHGVAQQRGVMPGQRRDDQHDRILAQLRQRVRIVAAALEAQQVAERKLDDFFFDDRRFAAVRQHRGDAERGFLVILAEAIQKLVARGHAIHAGHAREPVVGSGQCLGGGAGPGYEGIQQRAVEFVQVIEHGIPVRRGSITAAADE